jgi:hypothetical protein
MLTGGGDGDLMVVTQMLCDLLDRLEDSRVGCE